jgi:hypothetical protein
MLIFKSLSEDCEAVQTAVACARRFLREPSVTPPQIVHIGKALFALERLPTATSEASTEFGIEYRFGDETFSELAYISFRITESSFEITTGGSTCDKDIGGNSYAGSSWCAYIEGVGRPDLQLYSLESKLVEYLNLGARISTNDESEYDDFGA